MEKIAKQIVVNVLLIVLSVVVIVLAKMFTTKEFNIKNWESYMGSDILFVIVSSLITTCGWRFSEKIEIHWLYNLLVGFILVGFTFEYGIAVGVGNDFDNPIFSKLILFSLILFLVICFIEYMGIIIYFSRNMSQTCSDSRLVLDFRYRD